MFRVSAMSEEDLKKDIQEIRQACMKVVDVLDGLLEHLTVEISVAKITLEDVNTKLMFDDKSKK